MRWLPVLNKRCWRLVRDQLFESLLQPSVRCGQRPSFSYQTCPGLAERMSVAGIVEQALSRGSHRIRITIDKESIHAVDDRLANTAFGNSDDREPARTRF